MEAEHRDCVTIFFSDIVNFTSISSDLPPRKVADLLDRLYTKFDALSNAHEIFKVETIGDAYMAVTNLVKKQSDHAGIMARFALDAREAATGTLIDEDDPKAGHVQIRIGMHSGPVSSHVVGSKNPRYSIIGGTVKVAQLLERTSKGDRIQCSSEGAELIAKQTPETHEDAIKQMRHQRRKVKFGDAKENPLMDSSGSISASAQLQQQQQQQKEIAGTPKTRLEGITVNDLEVGFVKRKPSSPTSLQHPSVPVAAVPAVG